MPAESRRGNAAVAIVESLTAPWVAASLLLAFLAVALPLSLPAHLGGYSLAAEEPLDRCELPAPKSEDKQDKPKKAGKGTEKPVDAKAAERKRERRVKAMRFLEAQLLYAVSTNRRQAIGRIPSLKKSEQTAILPLVVKLAKGDRDPLVRETAARMLGRLKHEPAVPVLIEMLAEEDSDLLAATVGALGRLKAKAAAPKLFELLKKRKLTERDNFDELLIRTLGDLEHTDSAGHLLEKAKDRTTHIQTKQAILLYFGDVKYAAARPYLLEQAKDGDQTALSRAYAVNALGRIGDKGDTEPLRKLLREIGAMRNAAEQAKLSSVRLQLVSALVRLGDKDIEQELITAARDDDTFVRVRAIKQLGELRLKSARPLLCYKYKHDPSRGVRRAALAALKKVDGREE